MSSFVSAQEWTLRGQPFTWGTQTYMMGILNVTPDSFSDGGQFDTLSTALTQAQRLIAEGTHILDIGGQSTRPQAEEISLEAELDRVIPIITELRSAQLTTDAPSLASVPISVDTTRSAVARAAIQAGADLVNDISGATYDPDMLPMIAELQVPIVLMHIRGTPKTMQQLTDYQDVVSEIYEFLARRVEAATQAGVDPQRIMLDPGIGFAKTYEQNLEILRNIPRLQTLGCPILIGASRKSFIGHLLNQPNPQQRVWGTAAACCAAVAGGADLVRVHDVAAMRDVCQVADAIWRT